MSDENGFERLNLDGINFVQIGVDDAGTILFADFGGGYRATAVVNEDVREWLLQVDVLPDVEGEPSQLVDAGEQGFQTRARYLWEFRRRHMRAGQRPFWIRCPFEKADFLAEFPDMGLTYEVFTAVLYATGLRVRQRRVSGVESVGAPVPEVNPDSI